MSNRNQPQSQEQSQTPNINKFLNTINNANFLDDIIMNMAEKIGEELSEITVSKMRQYFDDIKGLRRKIKSGLSAQQVKVQLSLIKSRLAYDVGRASVGDKKSWKNFKGFIDKCIEKIFNSQDVIKVTNEFITFFESVYGYFYCKAHN